MSRNMFHYYTLCNCFLTLSSSALDEGWFCALLLFSLLSSNSDDNSAIVSHFCLNNFLHAFLLLILWSFFCFSFSQKIGDDSSTDVLVTATAGFGEGLLLEGINVFGLLASSSFASSSVSF